MASFKNFFGISLLNFFIIVETPTDSKGKNPNMAEGIGSNFSKPLTNSLSCFYPLLKHYLPKGQKTFDAGQIRDALANPYIPKQKDHFFVTLSIFYADLVRKRHEKLAP